MESVPKVVLLLACFAFSLCAQFSGLSVTRDGATVYFSSPLRLRNSNGNFDAKLFRISNGDVALFREQERGQSLGWYNEHFYNLAAPQVSIDGSMIAFTGVRSCGGGSGCLAVQKTQGTVVDSGGKVLVSAFGSVNITPNGQYALFFARNAFGGQIPATELISVGTGMGTTVPYVIAPAARRRVANDGTVVVFAQGGIRLWQAGSEQTLTGVSAGSRTDSVEPLLQIGADGRRIVYEMPTGLARYDRLTTSNEVLAARVPHSISIDENATVVVWVDPSDSQIYVTGPARQLTREEGIAEVALSGNGNVAFAVTCHGRMLRIDIASGAVSELIPRTPFITNPPLSGLHTYIYDAIAPGSLIPLTGTGLSSSSQSAVPPLPRTFGGVTVRIAGIPAAIQAVSPGVVWIQVPWELQEQQNAPLEFLSGDSSFETGPGTVNVTARAPHSFATSDTSQGYSIYITAVHEDWSGLVTRNSPARSGEIITAYFSGLGPVAPAVATGQSSPADPPARVVGPLRCQFWDGGANDSRLYFAGLAPGMVGVYQVSLEVPTGLRVSSPALSCDFGPGSGTAAVGSIFVVNQ